MRPWHFAKTFTRYEQRAERVVAYFEDSSCAEGDVLVAADGGASRVRRQFLPHPLRIDAGAVGIAGKIFLDTARDRDRTAVARRHQPCLPRVVASGCLSRFIGIAEQADGAALSAVVVKRLMAERDRRGIT